jgi:ribonuclease BN (tRNA processing enzyme)
VLDDSGVPTLVLDAGTGLRELTGLLGRAPFRGSIVLTHLHWDHLQGLPFSPALGRPEARVDLYLPSERPVEQLERFMSPPLFPIGPSGLGGTWRIRSNVNGDLEGYDVRVAEIAHKGGTTHGIRVSRDGVSVAYLPDHCPQQGSAAAEELAADVDLLLHDGQFLAGEQGIADAYGHATIPGALAFAERCGARRLVLTHHGPRRVDDDLDVLAKDLAGIADVAREGDILTV